MRREFRAVAKRGATQNGPVPSPWRRPPTGGGSGPVRDGHGQRGAEGCQSRREPIDGLIEETQRRRAIVPTLRVVEGGHCQAAAAGDIQKALDLCVQVKLVLLA